jgi:hypothetical protein
MSQGKLIIFVRNPRKGKVKTRLAATIGADRALEIYQILLDRTHEITSELPQKKLLYYSDSIDEKDQWEKKKYEKHKQRGRDLGRRMKSAFRDAFKKSDGPVCIIGSDCYELTPEIIESAFEHLKSYDVVIGPSLDGGYYLIGMNKLHRSLFEGKKWSSDSVFMDTIRTIEKLKLNAIVLPFLQDVDTEEDLKTIR